MYHIVVKRFILNLIVLFSSIESLFLTHELFGKMPITIIVWGALSSSENYKLFILVLMGNFLAGNY